MKTALLRKATLRRIGVRWFERTRRVGSIDLRIGVHVDRTAGHYLVLRSKGEIRTGDYVDSLRAAVRRARWEWQHP